MMHELATVGWNLKLLLDYYETVMLELFEIFLTMVYVSTLYILLSLCMSVNLDFFIGILVFPCKIITMKQILI